MADHPEMQKPDGQRAEIADRISELLATESRQYLPAKVSTGKFIFRDTRAETELIEGLQAVFDRKESERKERGSDG